MPNTDMLSMQNMQEYGDEKSICIICKTAGGMRFETAYYITLIGIEVRGVKR